MAPNALSTRPRRAFGGTRHTATLSEMTDVHPGRYRHFKGNAYEVILVARDTETEEPVVVYQALYGERGHWVRSLADFTARVNRDGYDGPRFVRID